MIDASIAGALARVARRAEDVGHAYEPGFVPQESDVARTEPLVVRDANPLSTAPPPGAYFVVADGVGERTYSQDGEFRFVSGALRTRDGALVLGFAGDGSQRRLVPLAVDPIDAALGRTSDPKIEPDGSVSCSLASIDPTTGSRKFKRVVVGRLALARLPAGTEPVRLDATHVRPPAGAAHHIGTPHDGTFPALATHVRQLGNIDLKRGMERLAEVYLSLDAWRGADRAREDADKTAMDLLK